MKPFIMKEYSLQSPLEKLFNKTPKRNFLIDVNNLFSQEPLDRISSESIRIIEEKYKISSSAKKFHTEFIEFLGVFLANNLSNQYSDANDFKSAKKFQNILGISNKDFLTQYEQIAHDVFKDMVEKTLNASNKFKEEEETKFEKIMKQIGLEHEKAEEIINICRQSVAQQFMDKIVSDSIISPQETEAFEKLCDDLSVTVTIDQKSREAIERYKNNWLIEFGDLPTVDPGIILQKKEICYFKSFTKWYENRRVTKSIDYSGFHGRINIAKGLSYRTGTVEVNRQTEDLLTLIDEGTIHITNKRIIFKGNKQNKLIRYNQILDLALYIDGVSISKETGKSPVFTVPKESVEYVARIILRVIKDSLQ